MQLRSAPLGAIGRAANAESLQHDSCPAATFCQLGVGLGAVVITCLLACLAACLLDCLHQGHARILISLGHGCGNQSTFENRACIFIRRSLIVERRVGCESHARRDRGCPVQSWRQQLIDRYSAVFKSSCRPCCLAGIAFRCTTDADPASQRLRPSECGRIEPAQRWTCGALDPRFRG